MYGILIYSSNMRFVPLELARCEDWVCAFFVLPVRDDERVRYFVKRKGESETRGEGEGTPFDRARQSCLVENRGAD